MKQAESQVEHHARAIGHCQKILRLSTGIILVSFALIVLLTTLSTGEEVRAVGKVLYWVIVADALVALGTWGWRTRLEKRLQEHAP